MQGGPVDNLRRYYQFDGMKLPEMSRQKVKAL